MQRKSFDGFDIYEGEIENDVELQDLEQMLLMAFSNHRGLQIIVRQPNEEEVREHLFKKNSGAT